MAEETTTEPAVSEPAVEPAPAQPEPAVITPPTPGPTTEPVAVEETFQPTPEATADTATAQPVEPLNPEPISEPQLAPEPMPEPVIEATATIPNPEPEPVFQPESPATPEPQVIASMFPISRARELLIKARDVIQFRKRKKLEKIMGMFLKQASITNDDVQKLVYVSDATATRYLDQLEREGRIKKENAGKYLSYSRM